MTQPSAGLRITRTGSPAGLVIAGDIDEFSHAILIGALSELADVPGEIHLDLAGVEYCDIAGLRSMVRLAKSSAGGRDSGARVVLHAVPPQLKTVLRIVGWDAAPGLVLAASGLVIGEPPSGEPRSGEREGCGS